MDWSYIAGFFDGEGNINIQKISEKGGKFIKTYQINLRFYNNDLNVLTKIQEFLGCGKIYINGNRQNKNAAHELSIVGKANVQIILQNLQKHCITKQNKISYILNHYKFNRDNNFTFNLGEFHKLTERKNVEKFYIQKEFTSKLSR